MLLAIDIGNTNLVFGIFEGKKNGKLLGNFRIETRHSRTADEYFALFQPNFSRINKSTNQQINKIIISSVVPETKFEIESFCKKHLGITPVGVSEIKNKLNLKINLDNPSEVGADRLVNSFAVQNLYKKPAIIIDFGTATTFDVIDGKGGYHGGVIAPGINLSLSALQNYASKLPRISIQKPSKVIGKSTKAAMQSGVYFGYLGLIEKLVDEITGEMPAIIGKKSENPLVIATGGLAKFYQSKKINIIDDNLTLKGLKFIGDLIINNVINK